MTDSSRRISYRSQGETKRIRLEQFVLRLTDPTKRGQVRAICQSMVNDPGDRLLLVVVMAAIEVGVVDIDPDFAPEFQVHCIRALLGLNAAESAYSASIALIGDQEALALLPDRELRRLDSLRARAASRSGRPDEARDLYLGLYLHDVTDVTGFRELLGSVFSIEPHLTDLLCSVARKGTMKLRAQDELFVADLLRARGAHGDGFAMLQQIVAADATYRDAFLGIANVGLAIGNHELWRAAVEQYFAVDGGAVLYDYADEGVSRPFRFDAPSATATADHPLVSIIMTTYDAEATLELAVQSVIEQSCANWELYIVDDVSTDGTRALITELASRDSRIKPMFLDQNGGTYVAKNQAIIASAGEFVTFHDSDDWMHPMRVERHLGAMDAGVACSVSKWVRMDPDGLSIIRRGGPYTHLNPASTFFRRAALDTVGTFQPVRTGADAEMLSRVRSSLGSGSVIEIDSCLGLGLHHDASLTQSGATAFDEFRYSPVRLAYTESWLRWHVAQIADGRSLFESAETGIAFEVPKDILP